MSRIRKNNKELITKASSEIKRERERQTDKLLLIIILLLSGSAKKQNKNKSSVSILPFSPNHPPRLLEELCSEEELQGLKIRKHIDYGR